MWHFFRSSTAKSVTKETISSPTKGEEIEARLHRIEELLGKFQYLIVSGFQNISHTSQSDLTSLEMILKDYLQHTKQDTKQLKFSSEGQIQEIKGISKSLSNIEDQLNYLLKALEILASTQIAPIHERMDEIGKRSQDIEDKLPVLQNHMRSSLHHELESVCKNMEQKINQVKESVQEVSEGYRKTEEKIMGSMERIGRESLISLDEKIYRQEASIQDFEREIKKEVQTIQSVFVSLLSNIRQEGDILHEKIGAQIKQLETRLEEQTDKEINRLGKSIFKANNLLETSKDLFLKGMESFQSQKTKYEEEEKKIVDRIPEIIREKELKIAQEIFPAMDSLDAGIEMGAHLIQSGPGKKGLASFLASRQEKEHSEALVSWLNGIKLIRDRMLSLLQKMGIEPIPSVAQVFDPKLHCAVGIKKGTDNVIVEEVTRGYKNASHVIRYAEVIVGKENPDA